MIPAIPILVLIMIHHVAIIIIIVIMIIIITVIIITIVIIIILTRGRDLKDWVGLSPMVRKLLPRQSKRNFYYR